MYTTCDCWIFSHFFNISLFFSWQPTPRWCKWIPPVTSRTSNIALIRVIRGDPRAWSILQCCGSSHLGHSTRVRCFRPLLWKYRIPLPSQKSFNVKFSKHFFWQCRIAPDVFLMNLFSGIWYLAVIMLRFDRWIENDNRRFLFFFKQNFGETAAQSWSNTPISKLEGKLWKKMLFTRLERTVSMRYHTLNWSDFAKPGSLCYTEKKCPL